MSEAISITFKKKELDHKGITFNKEEREIILAEVKDFIAEYLNESVKGCITFTGIYAVENLIMRSVNFNKIEIFADTTKDLIDVADNLCQVPILLKDKYESLELKLTVNTCTRECLKATLYLVEDLVENSCVEIECIVKSTICKSDRFEWVLGYFTVMKPEYLIVDLLSRVVSNKVVNNSSTSEDIRDLYLAYCISKDYEMTELHFKEALSEVKFVEPVKTMKNVLAGIEYKISKDDAICEDFKKGLYVKSEHVMQGLTVQNILDRLFMLIAPFMPTAEIVDCITWNKSKGYWS